MLNIRPIKKTDIPELKSILALYWTDKDFLEHLIIRLQEAISNQKDSDRKATYFVAENNLEVLGVIGFRKLPAHMRSYTKTENPAELYILAVKNQGSGTGRILIEKVLSLTKELGYSEILLFSPVSLKTAWTFYDHMGFDRVGSAIAPNGEPGEMWQKIIQ